MAAPPVSRARTAVVAGVTVALVAAAAITGTTASAAVNPTAAVHPTAAANPGAAARKYLGTSPSSHRWFSGGYPGGHMSGTRANSWGTWRGSPSDMTLTFPEYATWTTMANSTWHIETYGTLRGRLMYGLPLLPKNARPAQLKDVAAGKHDATFRKIARDLRTRNRGNAVVKLGWEANGNWMSYSATAATAPTYRAAWRRVAQVMKKESPRLVFSFEVNCGTAMAGQRNRLDSLTKLYPGNDVTQLVGCSHYDWWTTGARTEAQWRASIKPARGPGLADVAAFARARGKGLSISEWGLASRSRQGNGDNPFFIRKMKQYFDANNDILAVEMYFNDPSGMGNSLLPEAPQNPKAAAEYRRLF
ncbi:hypothetical protein BJY21_002098 [Kineosphaera limosa]|uniref:GH26 domain-containing protein n=1 Tax=Kineosphaera limosa NBRC 100340 TaxID=1184609 RepID=K6W6S8_9MICO|nr:hypothetical protein [Kineosphaera limosa]NYE00914.1 hypothetical protein [Kineosphaera limosa]GAB94890.1 hypothetical protein KILIM_014_00260 [Kineosphaera limosa NBRC 100340]